MSVFSRIVLAGALCAAMGAQAFAAPTGDDPGSTRGRFFHAGKCVVTLGFSGGCDKDEADSKRVAAERKAAAEHPAEAAKPTADDTSTRHQFVRASKCVMSLGFVGNCDKSVPESTQAQRHAEAAAAPPAPDTSTKGRFFQASKCVASLGFLGDCDKKN
jgi:hypothetical protein